MAAERVVHNRPPAALAAFVNGALRPLLRTPVGRALPLALLEFTGRRSGRRYRVPVGWHALDEGHVVVTQGLWPTNFAGGREATVHHRGRARKARGEYIDDPEEVALVFRAILGGGTSPRSVALRVPPGHLVDAADIRRLDRSIIRFP